MKKILLLMACIFVLFACDWENGTTGGNDDFELIDSAATKDSAKDFIYNGTNFYVADGEAGISLFTIDTIINHEHTIKNPTGYSVDFDGYQYVYMAAGLNGVYVYDTSATNGMQSYSHFSDISASELIYQNQKVYVAAYDDGLQILDASNPYMLNVEKSWDLAASNSFSIAINDEVIALGCGDGIYVLDKYNLELLYKFSTSSQVNTLLFKNNMLYAGIGDNLFALKVNSDNSLEYKHGVNFRNYQVNDICIEDDNHLWVAVSSGLYLINIANSSNLYPVNSYKQGCLEVKKYEDKLVLACGQYGLQLLRYSDF